MLKSIGFSSGGWIAEDEEAAFKRLRQDRSRHYPSPLERNFCSGTSARIGRLLTNLSSTTDFMTTTLSIMVQFARKLYISSIQREESPSKRKCMVDRNDSETRVWVARPENENYTEIENKMTYFLRFIRFKRQPMALNHIWRYDYLPTKFHKGSQLCAARVQLLTFHSYKSNIRLRMKHGMKMLDGIEAPVTEILIQ